MITPSSGRLRYRRVTHFRTCYSVSVTGLSVICTPQIHTNTNTLRQFLETSLSLSRTCTCAHLLSFTHTIKAQLKSNVCGAACILRVTHLLSFLPCCSRQLSWVRLCWRSTLECPSGRTWRKWNIRHNIVQEDRGSERFARNILCTEGERGPADWATLVHHILSDEQDDQNGNHLLHAVYFLHYSVRGGEQGGEHFRSEPAPFAVPPWLGLALLHHRYLRGGGGWGRERGGRGRGTTCTGVALW